MPFLPDRKGRRESKESPDLRGPPEMMELSVRKESKASKARPGRKESLEILAVQSVLKGQQVPTERTALMEPKVRPER